MLPEQILAVILVIGIFLYAILGGADFGVGVWEVITAFKSSEKEKEHLTLAIGPVWEANHVWLIFILVILFSAFPPVFAAIGRSLWFPLLLALVGIIFRGVGFAFRSYVAGMVRQQTLWGAVFSFASTATPFFLGMAFGAAASGKSGILQNGDFSGNYLTGWISPFSIFSAFFFVGISTWLSAVYLTREAGSELCSREGEAPPALPVEGALPAPIIENKTTLILLWRRRSLVMSVVMGVLALAGLAIIANDAPFLWNIFKQRSLIFIVLAMLAGGISLWALWRNHFMMAALSSQGLVLSVILGWVVAQYPFLIFPLSMEAVKAPPAVLWAMIWSLAIGSVLLIPSLTFLLYLFKGKKPL
ncbi:MAG: cytochrome d ubiquinol oxidase subunit II [Deltaproteobacteria bacterium]|nr:cytochrome d ubiquinol oxidase subunit II [Deltaproteobacteria bacterium]